MTVPEMIFVLDKERDCIQRRTVGDCKKDCKNCECYMEPGNMLDAFERIVNLVYNIGKNRTRKEY